MLKLFPNYHFISYKSSCVVINKITGKWVRIPQEAWTIILTAVELQMDKETLLRNMHDDEDRLLILRIVDTLAHINILTDRDETVFIDDRPKVIYFSITHRCNLHCSHCCVSASSILEEEYSSTARMKEFIDKILSINPDVLVFTGGEPLVRADFVELVEYTRRCNPHVRLCLMTNATCISIHNVDFLVRHFDSFDVSIDGVDEDTCSLIRGQGVFKHVISGIKLLNEHGAKKVSLSMVLTNENIRHEARFDALCKELHVTPIKRIFEPVGRGKDNYSLLAAHPKQSTSSAHDKQKFVPIACTCGAGAHELSVDSKGDVFLCHSLDSNELKVGNLMEIINLKEFLSSHTYRLKYNQLSNKIFPWYVTPCKDCPVNYFCWKCPALFRRALETPEMIETRCRSHKEALLAAVWGEGKVSRQ